MKATRSKTFSDADLDETCDNCQEPLPGATQLWTIDNDDSRGFFCCKDCAEIEIAKALNAEVE